MLLVVVLVFFTLKLHLHVSKQFVTRIPSIPFFVTEIIFLKTGKTTSPTPAAKTLNSNSFLSIVFYKIEQGFRGMLVQQQNS